MGKSSHKSGPEVKRDSRSPRVHAGKSLYRKATSYSIYRDINLSPVPSLFAAKSIKTMNLLHE